MLKTVAVIFLSVVVLTGCNRKPTSSAPKGGLTSEEYGVLSGYIAGIFSGKENVEKDKLQLVFLNTTQSGDDHLSRDENGQRVAWEKTAAFLRTKAPALEPKTLDSFRRANSEQAVLSRSFLSPIEYELVDFTQLDSMFTKDRDGWLTFYKRYPRSNGIVTWSRVGFSPDGTQALFYFDKRCGGLCGGGHYVVMEKRNGRWVIETDIDTWVS